MKIVIIKLKIETKEERDQERLLESIKTYLKLHDVNVKEGSILGN